MDVSVLVIVSCGARRVELACAGPPHCVGSLFFREPMPSPPTLPAGLVSVSPFSHLCLIFLHPVSRASLFILIFSPLLYTQPHTPLHVTPRLAFMPFFSVSFTCRIVERNFVPRKRFKRYERALKQVLYEENVLGGTKSVCKGIWFRLKRLFGTKWRS